MNTMPFRLSVIFIAFWIVLFLPLHSLYAHGGKQHGSVEFTHLEAAKKATDLFDKLIASKKIDSDWELHLEQIKVFDRSKGDKAEVAVAFSRSTGEPKVLYIFFTSKGDYAGSNFTGE
jgi:hypothetical protein